MSSVGFGWTSSSGGSTPSTGLSFVNNGTPMTIASLMSNFPANEANKGKYANVTDLYGSVDDVMRCRFDGTNYRWVPQRESYSGTSATTGGTISLIPLISPPSLRLTGTLSTNSNIIPSTTNAYLGQRFRVTNNSTLGLLSMTITGLIGSSLTLLGSGSRDIEFGSSGWFASN